MTPSPAPAGTHDPSRRTTPPPSKMCPPSAAWERRAGRCGRPTLAEPPRRPWRTCATHATPSDEPTARPPLHPTLAHNPAHQAPHRTLPRTPLRPPPRPTISRTPPRQPPHRRHAPQCALHTRAAPHPATRHLWQPLSARRRRHGASRHGLLTAGWPWRPPAATELRASGSGPALLKWPFRRPGERRDSPPHPLGTPTPRNAHRRTRRHTLLIPHRAFVGRPTFRPLRRH